MLWWDVFLLFLCSVSILLSFLSLLKGVSKKKGTTTTTSNQILIELQLETPRLEISQMHPTASHQIGNSLKKYPFPVIIRGDLRSDITVDESYCFSIKEALRDQFLKQWLETKEGLFDLVQGAAHGELVGLYSIVATIPLQLRREGYPLCLFERVWVEVGNLGGHVQVSIDFN